ncbi:MAG: glycosyltransferase, partial [Bacteroidaceae bacterium]
SDFDWCIRIMKKSKIIHNTHLVVIDYLEEGITTQHHKASLIERFRIMNKHYGLLSTIVQHMGFVLRSFTK